MSSSATAPTRADEPAEPYAKGGAKKSLDHKHHAHARHHRHEQGIARMSRYVGAGAVSILESRESATMLNTLSKRYIVRRVPTGLKFQIASRERCETDEECGCPDQYKPYFLTPRYHKGTFDGFAADVKPLESAIVTRSDSDCAVKIFQDPAQIVGPVFGRDDKTTSFTEVPVMRAPGCKRPLRPQPIAWIWRETFRRRHAGRA